MLPVSFSDTFSQFRDLDWQGIRLDQIRVFSPSSSLLNLIYPVDGGDNPLDGFGTFPPVLDDLEVLV